MRTSIVTIGAALITVAVLIPAPASAVDTAQAIKLCEKNPNCRVVYPGENPGMCIRVGNDSCGHYVDCSTKTGKCDKIWIQAGGKRKPVRGNVGTVLTSAPNKPSKPVTSAGNGPQVKTTGSGGDSTRPGGAQQPSRKVVRDHRSQPVVRDHRTDPVVRDHRDKSVRAEGRPHR